MKNVFPLTTINHFVSVTKVVWFPVISNIRSNFAPKLLVEDMPKFAKNI